MVNAAGFELDCREVEYSRQTKVFERPVSEVLLMW
jgi:hypothetical protein